MNHHCPRIRTKPLRHTLLIVLILALTLTLPSAATAETTIDTTGSWDGSLNICCFGPNNHPSYGQTVTVPTTDNVLMSFSFWLHTLSSPLVFRGEVYAWDGSKATGSALWEGDAMTVSNTSGFQQITFNTGEISLTSGQQYILFATCAKDLASSSGAGEFGFITANVYSGGAFYNNDSQDPADWTQQNWWGLSGYDLAFKAEFAPPNTPPVPNAGGPYSVNEGGSVEMTGSATDAEGGPLTYTWDLDNDGTYETAGASTTFSPGSLDGPGVATVGFQVCDSRMACGAMTATVNIANTPPTATFDVPASVDEGSDISLWLIDQVDPSSADTAAGFTYAFDSGSGLGAPSSDDTTNCATTDNGTREVAGRIADKDGDYSHYTASVTINNVTPTVNAGTDAAIFVGQAFSQSGSFTDPGADTWEATVNYGDGSGEQPLALTNKTFALDHTYASTGDYTITVTVTDDDGGVGTDEVDVTVVGVPPAGTVITGPTSGTADVAYAFTTQVSPIDATTPITYTWTATDFPTPIVRSGGLTDTVQYTWTEPGLKTVSVSVQNEGEELPIGEATTTQSLIYTDSMNINITAPVAPVPPEVPEPGSLMLLAGGLAGLGGFAGLRSMVRRRAK